MSEGAEGVALNAASSIASTGAKKLKLRATQTSSANQGSHALFAWRRHLAACSDRQWLPEWIRRRVASFDGRLTAWLIRRAMQRLDAIAHARRKETLTRCAQLPLALALELGVHSEEIDDSPGCKLAEAVVKLQERNRELQMQVQLDALTGLRSRRALDQILQMRCGGQAAGAENCAVVFLDIDHFGIYNKRHGDDEGDRALRKVAQIIQTSARRGDHVFRKGGEELVAVLPGANGLEAQQVAERMRAAVEAAAIRHDGSPTASVITVTVGVAASHLRQTASLAQLMNRAAKKAMQAKTEAQRNQIHVG